MRSALPRRSFVLSALRRASTYGRLEPVALLRRGGGGGRRARQGRRVGRHLRDVLLRVLPAEVDRSTLLAVVDRSTGGDHVARLDVAERLERRLDAAAVALYAIGAVVWPSNVSVNVPAVAFGHAHGLGLVRLHVVEGTEAARVAAARGRVVARDQPQVAGLVEVDVASDVAAGAAVDRDPHDLLLAGRVQVRRLVAGALDELEARELEVADVGIPRRHARPGGGRRDRQLTGLRRSGSGSCASCRRTAGRP